MTFEDLPQNWTALPLTDAALAADVVDLLLPIDMRCADTLGVILCDHDAVGLPAPLAIDGMDWNASPARRRQLFETIAEIGVPFVVLALASAERLPDDVLDAWMSDAREVFEAADVQDRKSVV